MNSELFALGDNGLLYSWDWNKNAKPTNLPHSINKRFLNAENRNFIIFLYFYEF